MEKNIKIVLALSLLCLTFAGIGLYAKLNWFEITGNAILERNYGVPNEDLLFSQLPDPPDDFLWIKDKIERQQLTPKYFDTVDERYWKNPEFYPNFEKILMNVYMNPSTSAKGVYGYGSYPAEMVVKINKEDMEVGQELYGKTWFHTGYGISYYQGTKLKPIFLTEGAEEYFDVLIDPDLFLLTPTYPIFDPEWAKEIRYIVKVKKIPPKAIYDLAFSINRPPLSKSQEWMWDKRELYVDSGMFTTGSKPTFLYQIHVT